MSMLWTWPATASAWPSQRNLKAHVSEKHRPKLVRRLWEAYHETEYVTAKASLEVTARWLDRVNADAAASLREGLEETLTVVRLGVPRALRRTLATTNPIESSLSVTRRVTARVTRWRDGDMRRRWCAAGLLRAEELVPSPLSSGCGLTPDGLRMLQAIDALPRNQMTPGGRNGL